MFTIVAALKAELHPILGHLGPGMVSRLREGTLYAFPNLHLLRLGVGGQKAAETLDAYLALHQPEFVLNIGFAGVLSKVAQPCEVFRIHAVQSEKSNDMFVLNPLQGLEKLPSVRLLTVREAVKNEARKKALFQQFQADLADMEAFELIRVCRKHEIPIYIVKAVTDSAGNQAPEQFRSTFKLCARRLFQTIQHVLPK